MRPILASLAGGALCAAPLSSQLLDEGYGSALRTLAPSAGIVAAVGAGSLVWFDGTELVLDDGRSTRTLLSFGSSVFGSFAVPVSATELLFGESSTGGVWRVPFAGAGTPARLATIQFNFAACAYDGGRALVSAKTGGFVSPDNDVLMLDLQTGQTDLIALLPGASGPLAVDAALDVYYATASMAFPAPPGSSDVLRFGAAAVASAIGPTHLTIADAGYVQRALDSAGSFALDGDADLFIVDWANSRVLELSDIGAPQPRLEVFADYAGAPVSPAAVQFIRMVLGPSGALFEPFQPQLAGALLIHESAFLTASHARFALPRRAATTVTPDPVPAGPFAIVTTGGPRGGAGVLALGAAAAIGPELALPVAGVEQPLFWAFSQGAPALWLPVAFDGAGHHQLRLSNPGLGGPVTLACQLVFADAAGAVVGSADPATLTLQ